MSKLLVIIGVSGNQGSSVAEALLVDLSWKSLQEVFKDANLVFGNTAFDAAPIIFPTEESVAKLKPGQTAGEFALDKELQQGKNIADAVASMGDSSELFMWSSLSDSKKWSGGKYPGIYHFDSKSVVVDYIKEEYPDLTAKMSLLQLGWFVTNWKLGRVAVPWEKQTDGSMILRIPGSGDWPWPIPIVQPADTGEFVKALIKLPPGTELLAYGELMTMTEYMNLWSKATGVRATLVCATVDDHDKLLPGWGREIGETYAYMQEFGYWGGKNVDNAFQRFGPRSQHYKKMLMLYLTSKLRDAVCPDEVGEAQLGLGERIAAVGDLELPLKLGAGEDYLPDDGGEWDDFKEFRRWFLE
ncbi:hypothetical protein BP5796_07031 [Coleophoma crateriformis]|uniref:NmrA-like domain-containing protein n=1 Tax=Coleophoma crateriformis TaxID=565419 RepID=A0A3D8RHQ9_9HELO|nr:hypothetical protein BP5796_07031 [Coleophoma crateriformis]